MISPYTWFVCLNVPFLLYIYVRFRPAISFLVKRNQTMQSIYHNTSKYFYSLHTYMLVLWSFSRTMGWDIQIEQTCYLYATKHGVCIVEFSQNLGTHHCSYRQILILLTWGWWNSNHKVVNPSDVVKWGLPCTRWSLPSKTFQSHWVAWCAQGVLDIIMETSFRQNSYWFTIYGQTGHKSIQ